MPFTKRQWFVSLETLNNDSDCCCCLDLHCSTAPEITPREMFQGSKFHVPMFQGCKKNSLGEGGQEKQVSERRKTTLLVPYPFNLDNDLCNVFFFPLLILQCERYWREWALETVTECNNWSKNKEENCSGRTNILGLRALFLVLDLRAAIWSKKKLFSQRD